VWALRVVWATLPFTAGPAAAAALRDWSDAPRIAAEALLWITWGVGLLAAMAPRPLALVGLRTIAPAYLVLAVVVAVTDAASTIATIGAVVATALVAVLAAGDDIALAAANSASYGDEIRVPLRTPPALFLGPIPLARLLVVAGIAAPVLLLADEQWVWGGVALVVGALILAVLPNALFRLGRRWAVLVPAGFVIVDPMTLADPVLFLREHVVALSALPSDVAVGNGLDADATDLRLGASRGSIALRLDGEVDITLAARGRQPARTIGTAELLVASTRREQLLALAGARRLPVR
jgi:hypothetical protein